MSTETWVSTGATLGSKAHFDFHQGYPLVSFSWPSVGLEVPLSDVTKLTSTQITEIHNKYIKMRLVQNETYFEDTDGPEITDTDNGTDILKVPCWSLINCRQTKQHHKFLGGRVTWPDLR